MNFGTVLDKYRRNSWFWKYPQHLWLWQILPLLKDLLIQVRSADVISYETWWKRFVCYRPFVCVCVCVWGGGVHSPQRTSNTGFGVFFDFTQNKNISQATMNPILYDTMIEITVTSSWPLRSPAHRLHVQRYVHINQNANIKTPHGCSLVRWIQRDLYQRHILKENRYHCHKKGSNIIWVTIIPRFNLASYFDDNKCDFYLCQSTRKPNGKFQNAHFFISGIMHIHLFIHVHPCFTGPSCKTTRDTVQSRALKHNDSIFWCLWWFSARKAITNDIFSSLIQYTALCKCKFYL